MPFVGAGCGFSAAQGQGPKAPPAQARIAVAPEGQAQASCCPGKQLETVAAPVSLPVPPSSLPQATKATTHTAVTHPRFERAREAAPRNRFDHITHHLLVNHHRQHPTRLSTRVPRPHEKRRPIATDTWTPIDTGGPVTRPCGRNGPQGQATASGMSDGERGNIRGAALDALFAWYRRARDGQRLADAVHELPVSRSSASRAVMRPAPPTTWACVTRRLDRARPMRAGARAARSRGRRPCAGSGCAASAARAADAAPRCGPRPRRTC